MKKVIVILFIFVSLLFVTGCEYKRDQFEDVDIITTIYPTYYVTEKLYGESSNVVSIYPKGVDINTYKLTAKQLKDFSKKDLFIYNGNSSEREYAKSMIASNKNLKIVDAAYGVFEVNSSTDVWMNPSNILMIAQNIKNELEMNITNSFIIQEIEERYNLLKEDISGLEAEFKKTADNSKNVTIISSDESLLFLEKYGFDVINITDKGLIKENNLAKVKSLLNDKKVSYIFVREYQKANSTIEDLVNTYKVSKLTFRTLENITEKDAENNDDYLSIMYKNIEEIKKETYK